MNNEKTTTDISIPWLDELLNYFITDSEGHIVHLSSKLNQHMSQKVLQTHLKHPQENVVIKIGDLMLSCSRIMDNHFLYQEPILSQDLQLNTAYKSIFEQAMLSAVSKQMGHDLKNLLGIVINRFQYLQKKGYQAPPKELEQLTPIIKMALSTLQSFHQIQPDSKEQLDHFELKTLIQNIVNVMENGLNASGIDLIITIDDSIKIFCHPYKISQIIINLINNAQAAILRSIEFEQDYTKKHYIKIEGKRVDENIHLSVEDDGDSMTAPRNKKIEGGWGIGLFISKSYARDHQGEIVSEEISGIKRFTLVIPVGN